jgi:pimeloyl-ACP methyl ester carboxylesterase
MFALQLEAWADAPNVWECLPDIDAPTLLIVGELEQGKAGSVERAVQRLSNGRATLSPRFAHLQNFWHSEVTGPIISSFVATAHTNS